MIPKVELKKYIRDVCDYPKPGIVFRDITPLLQSPVARRFAVDAMQDLIESHSMQPDVIAGIEARGFIFASVVAHQMSLPLIPIRKKGKLPYTTVKFNYNLEYGTDTVEMHTDAVRKGQRVLVIDDLLATGGTAAAAARLIESVCAEPSFCFLIELDYLEGRKMLSNYPIVSVLHYEK